MKIVFSQELSHRLEAGADFFLMPSVYEPCGLNQLYSLAYGTIPIVHATGGLKDTVRDGVNGISFITLSPDDIVEAVERALELYGDKEKLGAVRREGMSEDFSWKVSAGKYEKLYTDLAAKA